ncbi:UNVERIFIED_CONTAM: hypothetical protein Sangu_2535700 [Sesamum angustifolium]|uniref:Reverse transcriptase zinc-binding domain-containing protein n=1 Tax=Sesamum angustifolium TaxID=2727405 RepID=A0AAW2JB39_9LAMI
MDAKLGSNPHSHGGLDLSSNERLGHGVNGGYFLTDRDLILGKPLSNLGCDDHPMWHHSKDGRFSIKSAYFVARDLDTQRLPSTSLSSSVPSWSFIWSVIVPNKIKVFSWKICTNAIPTSNNLMNIIQGTNACPLCQSIHEDIEHAVISYPFARQVGAYLTLDGILFHSRIEVWKLS